MPGSPHPYPILWSLAVEEHCYLVFPLALAALLRVGAGADAAGRRVGRGPAVACVAAVCVAGVGGLVGGCGAVVWAGGTAYAGPAPAGRVARVTRWVTDFADPALALAVLLAVGATALACGWWRGAAAWIVTCGATLAVMVALKLTFLANWAATRGGPVAGASGEGVLALRSPSGHTASAVLVYGGVAMMLGAPRPIWLAAGVAAGVVVGATRLALSVHSLSETLVGGGVGLLGIVALARAAGPPPGPLLRWAVAGSVLVTVVLLHGSHLQIERTLDVVARQLMLSLRP